MRGSKALRIVAALWAAIGLIAGISSVGWAVFESYREAYFKSALIAIAGVVFAAGMLAAATFCFLLAIEDNTRDQRKDLGP